MKFTDGLLRRYVSREPLPGDHNAIRFVDLSRCAGLRPCGGCAARGGHGSEVRQPGDAPSGRQHTLARGAALLRPRIEPALRIQPRRSHPLLQACGGGRPRLCDVLLGHRLRQRSAHQQPVARCGARGGGVGGGWEGSGVGWKCFRRRARLHRGGGEALRGRSQGRPGAAGPGLHGRDAGAVARAPGRHRRGHALRGSADGPAAVGLVAARRPAAAGHGRAARDPRGRAGQRPRASRGQPLLHPRRGGVAASREGAGGGWARREAGAGGRAPRAHARPHLHPRGPL